ncbi:MAG: hypothetical protein KF774_05080 [Planctomyces sp.]|nr:hypothetical protein [Planctomyces sp.]
MSTCLRKLQAMLIVAGLPLTAIGLLAGCGGAAPAPWETTWPARGEVTFKGEPLPNAIITLIPVNEGIPASIRPKATSGPDGVFELETYGSADGAPLGEYKAVVMRFPASKSKENPSVRPNDLPKKYARAETTDLKVVIEEGANVLPKLELK